MSNEKIRDDAEAALIKYLKTEKVYLQSLIFILEIEHDAFIGNSKIKKSWNDFQISSETIGLEAREYFRCATFFSLISSMEIFLQELIKCIIRIHPKKIGATTFKLSEILDMSSKDEVINKAIDEYLNKVMYKKPFEYLAEICDIFSIEKLKLEEYWSIYIEAKARRDVGIHNEWICNETYLRKISEAGLKTTLKLGEKITPASKEYIFNTSECMRKIAFNITELVIEAHFPNKSLSVIKPA